MFDRLRHRNLSAEESTAARDQRRADRAARRLERGEQTADKRAASLEAEARRNSAYNSGVGSIGGGNGPMGGSG